MNHVRNLNLLLITPYTPYPLSEGGKISQYAMIDYLRNIYQITLVLVSKNLEDDENINRLQNIWSNVNIESINIKTPAPADTNSFKSILKNLYKKFTQVSKKPVAIVNNYTDFDNHYIINTPYVKDRNFISQLKNITASNQFDLVQIDHFEFADLVFLFKGKIKSVFIHHEIKFARLESASFNTNDYNEYIKSYVKNAEIGLLKLFDKIIVFSEADKERLDRIDVLKGKVDSSPFPILEEDFANLEEPYQEFEKIVFVGGDEHLPNKDAVNWFAKNISPLLSKSTNLKLHVIGKWSIENQLEILNKSEKNIIFSGFVEDIKKYSKNSIMVVPLRIGSGIRTKILYAMAHGTPLISSSIGCEGIELLDKESVLIANTPQNFESCILTLLNNPIGAQNMAKNAQNIAREKYSQSAAGELRNKLLSEMMISK